MPNNISSPSLVETVGTVGSSPYSPVDGGASDSASRKKRRYLKRGEGVYRRVYAKQFMQPKQQGDAAVGLDESQSDLPGDYTSSMASLSRVRLQDISSQPVHTYHQSANAGDTSNDRDSNTRPAAADELPASTTWHGSSKLSGAVFKSNVAWEDKLKEEALELEEFQALERQIRKDVHVAAGSTHQSTSATQEAADEDELPGTSYLTMASSQQQQHQQQQHTQQLHPNPPSNTAWLSTLGISESDDNASNPSRPTSAAAPTRSSLADLSPQQKPYTAYTGLPAPTHQQSEPVQASNNQHLASMGVYNSNPAPGNGFAAQMDSADTAANRNHGDFDDQSVWTELDYGWDSVSQANGDVGHGHESDAGPGPSSAPVQPAGEDTDEAASTVSARMTNTFVRSLFKQGQPPSKPGAKAGSKGREPSAAEVARLQQLDAEVQKAQQERSASARMRTELEKAAMRLEQERVAWERRKEDELAAMEAAREAEQRRLTRERRVLEKQSRALLKLPNKKERGEMEALEAILQQERKDSRAKDARHKLTVERLRRQIFELQEKNKELREEVRWHEAQQLARSSWPAERPGSSEACAPAARAQPQTDAPTTPKRTNTPAPIPPSKPSPATPSQTKAPFSTSNENRARPAAATTTTSTKRPTPARATPSPQPPVSPSTKAKKSVSWDDRVALFEISDTLPPSDLDEYDSDADGPGSSDPDFDPTIADPATIYADLYPSALPPTTSSQLLAPTRARSTSHPHTTPSASSPAPTYSSQNGSLPTTTSIHQPHPPQNGSLGHLPSTHHSTPATGRKLTTRIALSPTHSAYNPNPPPSSSAQQRTATPPHHSRATPTHPTDSSPPVVDMHTALAGLHITLPVHRPPHTHQPNPSFPAARGPSSSAQQHTPHSTTQPTDAQPTANHHRGFTPSSSQAAATSHPAANSRAVATAAQPSSTASNARLQFMRISSASPAPPPAAQPTASAPMWPPTHLNLQPSHPNPTSVPPTTTATNHQSAAPTSAYANPLPQSTPSQPHPSHAPQTTVHQTAPGSHAPPPGSALPAHPPSAPSTSQTFPPAPRPSDLIHEARHPDGKVERQYASGWRAVLFANGTRKATAPTGACLICFTNGDVKRQLPDSRVEYYYAEVDTWHVTHPSGVEVFYFSNGQTEAHHPSKLKEIVFPDGILRRVLPDGTEQDIGTQDLSREVQLLCPALDHQYSSLWP